MLNPLFIITKYQKTEPVDSHCISPSLPPNQARHPPAYLSSRLRFKIAGGGGFIILPHLATR